MDKERFQGNRTRLKGELKKKSGKFTDDELLQFEGDDEIISGNAQQLFGDQKKKARSG